MKNWKTLALSMLAVFVLFNVLLLKEMPDSSASSIRAVKIAATGSSRSVRVQNEEITSRKLGATDIKGITKGSKQGLLRRWFLRGEPVSKRSTTITKAQSRENNVDGRRIEDQSVEEKYLSHPHFAGMSSSDQQTEAVPGASKEQATAGSKPQTKGGSSTGAIASVLNAEIKEALIERPARLESLSEAFAQRQEIIAAVAETNGSADAMVATEALPLAVPVSDVLDITKDASPSPEQQQQQQQQQALMDVREQPKAPLDPGEEAGNATEGSAEAKKPTTVAQEQSAGGEVAALDTNSSGLAARDASAAGGQEAAAAGQLHGGCQDLEEGCPEWAAEDGCIHHGPSFMLERCRKSCGVCGQPYLMQVPANVTLGNGVEMPRVGFGTAGLGLATEEATAWALASGYRLLDSAQAQEWYREDLVGQALLKSGVPRAQVFLTSKLHPRHHGYDEAMIQFTKSLSGLAVEYVDLFLLHYPSCWPGLCGEDFVPKGTWHDSWRALESLYDKGLVRAIGVSNFGIDELAELLAMARIKPALVQRHSDPLAADADVQAFCRIAGIQYQGYSTLGSQWLLHGLEQNPVLTNPVVDSVASESGRDAAQAVLRWALQHGQAIVPRSSKKERIAANRALDFVLSADQMQRIDSLDGSLQQIMNSARR